MWRISEKNGNDSLLGICRTEIAEKPEEVVKTVELEDYDSNLCNRVTNRFGLSVDLPFLI